MTTFKHLALAAMLAATLGLPALAEQRGGPSSGGWRPQSPAMQDTEMSSSKAMDTPCQGQPCGW